MSQYSQGLAGEQIAADYLNQQGYQVVQQRYRSRHGEIDLIVKKDKVVYFVEVKYRPEGRLGSGIAGINPAKKQHLLMAARAYLALKPARWKLAYLEVTRAGVLFREDVLHET